MTINYRKIFKYIWKFEKNKYLKLGLYTFILGVSFLILNQNKTKEVFNFLPIQSIHLEENQKYIEDKNLSIDIFNFFSSLDNINQKDFTKKDFYLNYYPFTTEHERKELSYIEEVYFYKLKDETNILLNDQGYLLTDLNNKISQLDLNINNNIFYDKLSNILLKNSVNFSNKDYIVTFFNTYDNYIYTIEVTNENNTEKNLIKKTTISKNKIYYENNNSYAYNRIKYNESINSYKELKENYFDTFFYLNIFFVFFLILLFDFSILLFKKMLVINIENNKIKNMKTIKIILEKEKKIEN